MFDLTNPIFTDADKAREHLESVNWPNGPVCPHCGECENVHRLQGKSTRPGLIQCNSCLKNFTVTVGTVFERSKIGLHKWMLATYLLSSSKKGMSAHQIHRMLGVTYKTAWFMCHRIREAMDGANSGTGPLGGEGKTVEVDETYVGGKTKNRAYRKPAPKKLVVSLVERGGRARSFQLPGYFVKADDVRALVVTNIDRASHFMTDENAIYKKMGAEFSSHGSVSHSTRVYADGKKHSNTVENFFSVFKRGIIGTYHHLSEQHLARYLAEFDMRGSTRDISDAERADEILKGGIGRRLTYRRTDTVAA
ncbi:MAG: IS1595 family transposase [Croceibacterium sp.]